MLNKLTLGVCYYPEHWDRSLWAEDLDRMLALGIRVVRIGEFAWSKVEPREGEFTFAFFDEFLDLCLEKEMQVIFCTPTATPPAWLTSRYPEVLNADREGHLFTHGSRRHVNLNSPKYLELTERIVTALARHYGSHSAIVGWQLDNEINCERDIYCSESDHAAFREYLRDTYGTLENLNGKMGTVFWNQEYTDWSQIRLPGKSNMDETNPHIRLEEKRFISQTCIHYMKLQTDILRRWSPGRFVTSNGIFNNLDYHALTDGVLDLYAQDNYPNFAYDSQVDYDPEGFNHRENTYHLTMNRSISPKKFGIMEQQSGAGGWHTRMLQPMPEPGQMKLWALGVVAMGGDFVTFFRWRTCTVGTEIYWHGLNDYANTPNRRLEEAGQIRDAFSRIAGVCGKPYRAQAAIVMDYDNRWDGDTDQWHGRLERTGALAWQRAMEYDHITYDFVFLKDSSPETVLDRYEFAVYPHPSILTPARAAILEGYVARGGKLLVGARSGYKDIHGHAVTQPMPGLLRELCGVTVEEYTILSPKYPDMAIALGGQSLPAPIFNDVLRPETARVLGAFTGGYYRGKPGFTANAFGQGAAYYFGAGFTQESAHALLAEIGIRPLFDGLFRCSRHIQFTLRTDGQEQWLFFLNYKGRPEALSLDKPMTDLLSGRVYHGDTLLEPYQSVVFKL